MGIGYNASTSAINQYLDQKYDFYTANNMTNFTSEMPSIFMPQDQPFKLPIQGEEENNFESQPNDFQSTIKQLEDYFGSFDNFNQTMSLMRHHHRRFSNMNDDEFNTEMQDFK